MKASLVAYDFRELYKKSNLKIIEYEYIKFPKIANYPNLVAQNFRD